MIFGRFKRRNPRAVGSNRQILDRNVVVASGPMSTPQVVTNNPTGGPNTVMQMVISQLPPPIVTT